MKVWQYSESGTPWEFTFKILSEKVLSEFRDGRIIKNPAPCYSEKVIYELLD